MVGTEGSENKQNRITSIRHGERFCPTNHHCPDASRFLMIVSEENAVNARMGTIPRHTETSSLVSVMRVMSGPHDAANKIFVYLYKLRPLFPA